MTNDRQLAQARRFLAMHRSADGFVIPNVWDAGSARIMEQVGFPVVATTSAGISFSGGVPDGHLSGSEMLDRLAGIVAAVGCPVSADLESGYGPRPADVAATIRAAVDIGVVGANIEDSRPDDSSRLYELDVAAARIEAARSAAPSGSFVLNARIDAYLVQLPDAFSETVERAQRYVEAGADCIFVPGVDDPDTIRSLAARVPAPLNVVAGLTGTVLDVATLRSLGVARISIGGSLARAVLGYVQRAGREMLAEGTFGFTADAIGHQELQSRFGPSPTARSREPERTVERPL